MDESKTIGEILSTETLILRHSVGTAEDSDGLKYEMTTSLNMSPLIRSHRTGKYFVLSWANIIDLAVNAGINEE